MRVSPFPFRARSSEFEKALVREIQLECKQVRDQVIPERNSQSFCHGSSWRTKPIADGDEAGEMRTHTIETSTHFEDIATHKLDILPDFRRSIVEGMRKQFMRMIYETINESTEKSGNVVNAQDHKSEAAAFLAMLQNIEFGVDEYGNVSLPEIHLGKLAFDRMFASFAEQGVEFEQKVEKVKKEKIKAALEQEKIRLSKFMSSGDV